MDNYPKCKQIICANQNTKTGWVDTKTRLICMLSTRAHFRTRDTYRLKVRGWKAVFHGNQNKKKTGVAILIPDRTDCKTKTVMRDKEGHYIMIKGSIQDDIKTANIYAPNIGAPQYIRQILTVKVEINSNAIVVQIKYH